MVSAALPASRSSLNCPSSSGNLPPGMLGALHPKFLVSRSWRGSGVGGVGGCISPTPPPPGDFG